MNGGQNDLLHINNKRKIDANVSSTSAGGSSSRKSSRRKDKCY